MTDARARRRTAGVLGIVIVVAAFAYLVWGGLGKNVVYFYTPVELMARGDGAYDRAVRLGGQVAPGSVQWDPAKLDLRFMVTDGRQTIPVRSRGAPPQMFRDGMGVVVEGRFHKDGIFESTNLMVRHSNEYHPPKPGESPQEMYKSLIKETKS